MKPFLDKRRNGSGGNIVRSEKDQIIIEPKQIYQTLNPYYVSVMQNIGQPDEINNFLLKQQCLLSLRTLNAILRSTNISKTYIHNIIIG